MASTKSLKTHSRTSLPCWSFHSGLVFKRASISVEERAGFIRFTSRMIQAGTRYDPWQVRLPQPLYYPGECPRQNVPVHATSYHDTFTFMATRYEPAERQIPSRSGRRPSASL